MDVNGKRFLIVGMARSGVASARLLTAHGAQVTLSDRNDLESFEGRLDELMLLPGVTFRLGEDPSALLAEVDGVVISPAVPIKSAFIAEARALGKQVIGELELGFLLSCGTVVAITGTNGKTTTTELTGEIFRNFGKLTHVCGNIGLPITAIADNTHPEDVVVCEVSSFQLESIRKFRPRVAAILNIREDHLDRHGSMEEYARLKLRLLENLGEGDFAVLNADDETLYAFSKAYGGHQLLFSRKRELENGVFVREGTVTFQSDGIAHAICPVSEMLIPGSHNIENALAATAIACVSGVPFPVIRHTLRTFQGVEHRIENAGDVRGVKFINDSKGTNVDSTLSAIESMRVPTILLLGGYDKHADFAPLAKAISGSNIRAVVALGATRRLIADALSAGGFEHVTISDEGFESCVRLAYGMAKPGECVLLSPACASFDMFKDFEERGRVFKAIVRKLREENG